MTNALNVIGKPYNADAVMIGYAYDTQDELKRTGGRTDRRYRLHILTSTGDSAIVKYKGIRYYVYGVYDAESKRRTFYVEYARN